MSLITLLTRIVTLPWWYGTDNTVISSGYSSIRPAMPSSGLNSEFDLKKKRKKTDVFREREPLIRGAFNIFWKFYFLLV